VGLDPGDPVFMRRVNGWLTVLWIAMIPVSIISIITHWISSVDLRRRSFPVGARPWHWSAWQAAGSRSTSNGKAEKRAHADLPGEIVERLVRDTEVDAEAPIG